MQARPDAAGRSRPSGGNAILALQRKIGNKAVTALLAGDRLPSESLALQRAFAPALLNSRAHLRQPGAGGTVRTGTKSGRRIPKGAEIVTDPAQTVRQRRKVLADVTWAKAVDTRAGAWNPAADPGRADYIRQSSVTPVAYPKAATLDVGSRGHFDVNRHWHEDVGEYTLFENSIENPANRIVRVRGAWRSLTTANQLLALSPLEQTQVDDVSRQHAAEERLRIILTDAANTRGLNPALLTTPHNIGGLEHPLRLDVATGSQRERDRWYSWSQAVFAKIAQGAGELVDSILHWRATVYPGNPALCVVQQVEMEGSDLHDKGLGAVFVTYSKPNDATGMFPNVASVKVVLKPEDRNIERSLFGQQAGSLANVVNAHVGLNAGDAISTIKMETHNTYGSIIEFVRGQQARAINNTGADSQAMSEGIAFAFLAGMSDVHRDNVIYVGDKPYFIDADNSLNASRLNQASGQSGFSSYRQTQADTDIDAINTNPAASRSAIIQALLADSMPLLQAVTNAFQGKTGRVVPLYTNFWANQLKINGYIAADLGSPTDDLATDPVVTRWGIVNDCVRRLSNGGPSSGPGLSGEAGTSPTNPMFDSAEAKTQTMADLNQGKIPFFTYDYTSGHVLQNGRVIWHGQSLADAVSILMAKFPPPPPPVVPPPPVLVGTGTT